MPRLSLEPFRQNPGFSEYPLRAVGANRTGTLSSTPLPAMDLLLAAARAAARAAVQVHSRHFRRLDPAAAWEKGPSDFVSQVDLEAQEAALGVIRERFPGHAILAEETGVQGVSGRPPDPSPSSQTVATPGGSEGTGAAPRGDLRETGSPPPEPSGRLWPPDGTPLWIVDPLDGTTNFLHGHPMFAVSVAVGRRDPAARAGGKILAGVVAAARTGEEWWAVRGGGAWKSGLPIRVSRVGRLKEALVGTGFPFKEPSLVPRYLGQLGRVLVASSGVRRCGSAALDLCYVAEGILDAFWEEAYLSPWDVAAGSLILEEAGGVALRLDGTPLDLRDGSVLAANSPALLEELGRVVAGKGFDLNP